MMARNPASFRLDEDTLVLLKFLSSRLNLTQAQVVENAINAYAREQATKDLRTLREWWKRIPPQTREALQELGRDAEPSVLRRQAKLKEDE